MGSFKSAEWQDCVESLETWYFEAVQYIHENGTRDTRTLLGLTDKVSDLVRGTAGIDPMPIWDVHRFIENRRRDAARPWNDGPAEYWKPVAVEVIADTLQQVQMILSQCLRISDAPQPTSTRKKLTPGQQEIVEVIQAAGRRLTATEIMDALSRDGKVVSEGTTKTYLATLIRLGVLDNRQDESPVGYGVLGGYTTG